MLERQWTEEQNNAIQSRGGTLLVSAAAGSGKTAVLVERVISMLLDEKDPVDADRILVVTFSNAAAKQMRQRIDQRLALEQAKDPYSRRLRRQRFLMERAHISTIHAFCLDLVEENTQQLGLPADFTLGDESRLALLKEEAAAQAVEGFYAADEDGHFSDLVELLSGGRDDNRVVDTLFKLHDFLRSHPFYEDWLAKKERMYDSSIPVAQTVWGRAILDYGEKAVDFCLSQNRWMLSRMDGIEALEKAYRPAFQEDGKNLEFLLKTIRSAQWDDCCRLLSEFSFPRLGGLRGFEDDALKSFLQTGRDQIKKIVKNLSQRQFSAGEADFAEDLRDLRPKIAALFSLVLDYDRRLSQLKREQKILDFSDLEHFALSLLMEPDGEGDYRPTPLARQLSQSFHEVLVDEYQDTNSAQDMLFFALSRNGENLFMVGDVKQSIYRFRQAMPEIFLEKQERFAPFSEGIFPAKISLGKNFRSRREVTGFVNFVFSHLMSRQMGEMDYADGERLVSAAAYPEKKGMQTELHLIDTGGSELTAPQQEAAYVAGQIVRLITEEQVWEDGVYRPVRFGDICVLLRSPKNKAQIYREAFLRQGIPSWAESQNALLQAREVTAVTALLQTLDNPYRDIPLLTVLLSDIGGFTPEEIAKLRLLDRQGSIYSCLQLSAERENEKSAEFLSFLGGLRRSAAVSPVPDLLTEIYAKTDYPAIVSAYPMGQQRQANLLKLCDYAAAFEQSGRKGLYPFVRFLDRLAQQKTDIATPGGGDGGADLVAVTSIHRSKGLEYPFVFLCDNAKAFNKRDLWEKTALHPQLGFACVRRDKRLLKEFTTIPLEALRLENERAGLSEELRVLYVALTRAKEKLFITMAGDPQKLVRKAVSGEGKIHPFAVRSADSVGEWLLMCAVRHPSWPTQLAENAALILAEGAEQAPFSVILAQPPEVLEQTEEEKDRDAIPLDQTVFLQLLENGNWRYPYEEAVGIPQKLGVSEVAGQDASGQYAFSKVPAFLQGGQLSAAQKGSSLHQFMQYADYAAAATDPEGELERLRRMDYLSPAQAEVIDLGRVARFFSSDLYRRMEKSPRVEREMRFIREMDSAQMGYSAGESIAVQGVADCVFWEDGQLVIVDYKTDFVHTAQELVQRYREQLRLYKMILSQSLETPVKECVIYSFHLGAAIPLVWPDEQVEETPLD